MIRAMCAARRHLRPLLALCLTGVLVAYAAPPRRFIRMSFDFNTDPAEMYLEGRPGSWFEYPALYRWVDEPELRQGRMELGKVIVLKPAYSRLEFSVPPIEFDNARLDASAWEETTPKDAGSEETGWANDTYEGAPCLSRSYKYRKPVVLSYDRRLYLTIVVKEPQGARAYANGKLVDSVSAEGLTVSYPLTAEHYQQGYFLGDSLTFVRYGYLPRPFQYRFGLDAGKDQSQADIQRYEYVTLARDPSVPAEFLAPPRYAQPSSPQYEAARAKVYEGARAECEQALVEWESAMRGCAAVGLDAKALDKVAVASDAESSLGSPAKDEAARRLRVARKTLDGAKARLRSLHLE